MCRNPSFGLATKAKGGCKVAGQEEVRELRQEEARESRQEEARESHHILPGVLESVREYEGVNPHTPKTTRTLGDGLPVDSRNFRERFQGSKPNGLWRSLYH
jgi:predicted ThiF/HesA family dinucleotide-utilizing enzyme